MYLWSIWLFRVNLGLTGLFSLGFIEGWLCWVGLGFLYGWFQVYSKSSLDRFWFRVNLGLFRAI